MRDFHGKPSCFAAVQLIRHDSHFANQVGPAGECMSSVSSPKQVAASLSEFWSPRVIAEVDDAYIKVAKIHGSLAWHCHENEDELFLVLKGHLRIEMEGGSVELDEGEMFVVPKGVRHNPVAEHECHIMLIERKTTLHTGNIVTEKTRSLADQLRPV
jgi:mannose-6-phosphate isomerase-like protein (cupin superfamily)